MAWARIIRQGRSTYDVLEKWTCFPLLGSRTDRGRAIQHGVSSVRKPAYLLVVFLMIGCGQTSNPVEHALAPQQLAQQEAGQQRPSGLVQPAADPSTAPNTPNQVLEQTVAPVNQVQSTDWKDLPVIPDLSQRAIEIYLAGLERGNRPGAFSKVGDGEIASSWFLSTFEAPVKTYDLGPFAQLEAAIQSFPGSFARRSLAAYPGFNTSRILDPDYRDQVLCMPEETPLDCELRDHNPSLVILSLGTNQIWRPDEFELELRVILDRLIRAGVLPILSTKGDNLEGDHRINQIIGRLADEYDLPLWNFWRAIQPLPAHGLQPDGEHLTWAENDFADAVAMEHAWPVRNLTALQLLNSVWITLESSSPNAR